MSLWTRLKNLFTGKGWQETTTEPEEELNEIIKETPEEKAEEQQYTIKETKKETTTPKEKTAQKTTPKKIKEKETPEIRKAVQKYQEKPTIKSVETKLKPNIVNTINIPITQSLNEITPHYQKILTENAKLNDNDILNVLIEHREQLQHRFTITIWIELDQKQAGKLEIQGALIEHSNLVYEHINIGQKIEYLTEILNNLGNEFQHRYNSIGATPTVAIEKGEVTNITAEVSFA